MDSFEIGSKIPVVQTCGRVLEHRSKTADVFPAKAGVVLVLYPTIEKLILKVDFK